MPQRDYKIGPLVMEFLIKEAQNYPNYCKDHIRIMDEAFEKDYFEVIKIRYQDKNNKRKFEISIEQNDQKMHAKIDMFKGLMISDFSATITEIDFPASKFNAMINKDNIDNELNDIIKIKGIPFNPIITDQDVSEGCLYLHYDNPYLSWKDSKKELLSMLSD